ncbi:protein sidekick-2-like isoform X2 [Asterias amurensis]|uniref:protein sidekick-2-like isoform X2 n=1 Tax=Asterias amurensis TaxID=7602 RepID=UPI003AB58BA2
MMFPVKHQLVFGTDTKQNMASDRNCIRRTNKNFLCKKLDSNLNARIYGSSNLWSWMLAAWFLHSCIWISSCAVQPYITEHPEGDTTVENNRESLKCRALGDPPLEYQWLKDDLPLGAYDSDMRTLILTNIQRTNAGEYRCLVRNPVGTIMSRSADLYVAYLESFSGGPSTETATAGQATLLSCPSIESYPLPTVTWRKDGVEIYNDANKKTTIDNRLVILDSSTSDQGVYTCKAESIDTGDFAVSSDITLAVQGSTPATVAPTIVVPPSNIIVTQGETIARMECIVNARPLADLEMTWKHNSVVISTGGSELFELLIRSPSQSDVGIYECEASLPGFQPVSASANLTLYIPPTFVTTFEDITISSVGSDVAIPCAATGNSRPTVTWFRNAVDVTALGDSRFQVLQSGTLEIRSTEAVDAGMYQCMVNNEAGEDIKDTWLQVREIAPTFTSHPNDTTVIEGQPATIQCQATGAPKPTISWLRDGALPVPDDYIQESGDLVFTQTQASDTGDYTCLADNGVGTINATVRLTVYLPTFIQTRPEDTEVQLSLLTIMDCVVHRDPAVTVSVIWYHNSVPIDPDSTSRVNLLPSGSLEITQARRSDKGEYECVVTSVAGDDAASATLTILELPQMPTNVMATISPTDSRTILLSWVPAFDGNSPLLRYIIEQKEDESSFREIDSNIDPSLTTSPIVGVIPSRSYQFRVTAENWLGRGETSDVTTVLHIPEEPPDEAPDNIVTSASSTTTIIVEWQEPPEDSWNGVLQGYILRFRLSGYDTIPFMVRNITSVRQTSFTLTELSTWDRYEIQVAAYNGAGVGVFSPSVRQRTKEGVPTEAPRNARINVISSTAILFRWEAPDPQSINGINQGYKLQAWEAGQEDSKTEVRFAPDPTNIIQEGTITGLKKYTEYMTSVLCYTGPGDGPASPTVTLWTQQDTPGPVGSLELKDVLDTSLKVKWKEPTEINGILTGYEIQWEEYNITDSTAQPIRLLAGQTQYTVTGLTATTMYSLTMWALTSVGAGPPTELVFSSGVPPLPPGPPTRLTLSNIKSRSVDIKFTPGFAGHTSISTWIVEAMVGTSQDWLVIYNHHDPDADGFTIPELIPYMDYSFRLRAQNVVEKSPASESTEQIQTEQDIPEIAPREVTVRATSETTLRVRWVPLLDSQWSGEPLGYIISWTEVNTMTPDPPSGSYYFPDPYVGEYIITGLQEWTEYSVQIEARNEEGRGPASSALIERTSDTVPSSGPINVAAQATGATTITVTWGPVPKIDQNGAILGYKVLYMYQQSNSGTEVLDVPGEDASTGMVTGLRGYTSYTLTVLAYTRMGDGTSSQAVIVETEESVPGPPTGILFPVVTDTSVMITWQSPMQPNGEIVGYRVSHLEMGYPDSFSQVNEVGMDQDFTVSSLLPNMFYIFNVTAKTRLGWGEDATALVYTTNDRTIPTAPSQPNVDHIQSREARISWTPGSDGNGPLRSYSIQVKEGDADFQDYAIDVDPEVIFYVVDELSPYTEYQFRLRAHNDVGPSDYSDDSDKISTDQDVPDGQPSIQEVIPVTPTSVMVSWTAPPTDTHNGPLLGYRIYYKELQNDDAASLERVTTDPALLEFLLTNLVRYQDYEFKVRSYNVRGAGPYSLPVTDYVGVAIPSAAPSNVGASATGPSSLMVTWDALSLDSQNGGLQGYKITYWETSDKSGTQRTKTFPSQETQANLEGLNCYTDYTLTVIGFNSAGDGPDSAQTSGTTSTSAPGVPSLVSFRQIRMSSLNVTWETPELPCGRITGYQVYYESVTPIDGEISTITVEINEPLLMYGVDNLGEFAKYIFRVKAKSDARGYGPYAEANITTGPQVGAPGPPGMLKLEPSAEYLTMTWSRPSDIGASDLIGYIIEYQEEDRSAEWETLTDSVSPAVESFSVSYINLKALTNYKFRIMAENAHSISFPKATVDFYATPANGVAQKMFYEEMWFLAIVGLVVLIVLILITATLCMLGKSRLYKDRKTHKRVTQEEQMSIDDAGFSAAYEMQNSGTNGRGAGRGRARGGSRNGAYSRTNSYTRPPPRPSPGSIEYSEEEESKHYEAVHRQMRPDQEETSSLTEKADLQSQTDSQASESDVEYTEDPHSFVNHYTNVPTFPSHSWRRQKGPKAYSYTDSESDMHSIHVNGLAGMPAGSRAPLHGFSSFV